MIAGSSGIGKSTLATALTGQMAERQFEFCALDPEGGYAELEQAVPTGSVTGAPNREEVLKLITALGANVVVKTQALEAEERPGYFGALLPQISALRARTGRPHWLLIDEAHQLLPARRGGPGQVLPDELTAAIFITAHPEAVAIGALRKVTSVVASGSSARDVVKTFFAAIQTPVPGALPEPSGDEALFYSTSGEAFTFTPKRPCQVHKRHTRKYAEGDLGPDRSFYFRGPSNALNLRTQNLNLFTQIASGVDDSTWEFHRKAGHFSEWFRNAIKNDDLAKEAAAIEANRQLDARTSRAQIRDAIRRRYAAPAQRARE